MDIAKELNKTAEHESENYTNCNWSSLYSHQSIGKSIGGLGIKLNRTKSRIMYD